MKRLEQSRPGSSQARRDGLSEIARAKAKSPLHRIPSRRYDDRLERLRGSAGECLHRTCPECLVGAKVEFGRLAVVIRSDDRR
jgi:hypothetical protein